MTENIRLIFSRTLVHPNIFRSRLFRVFFDAWFLDNKFPTELISPISELHFLFATIFQYFSFIQFPPTSYSKHKVSYGCSLQWWKPFVDIFFHLWEIRKQALGNIKKTALILSSKSVNKLIRGVVAAVRLVRNHSKSTSIEFCCIYNNLFPLRFDFYAPVKLQLNCGFTILPFSGP